MDDERAGWEENDLTVVRGLVYASAGFLMPTVIAQMGKLRSQQQRGKKSEFSKVSHSLIPPAHPLPLSGWGLQSSADAENEKGSEPQNTESAPQT